MPNTGWMDEGLCREVDPDLFFPEEAPQYADPKLICMSCSVRQTCLSYALDNMADGYDVGQFGMWGGTTPPERRRMLQFGRRAA
jgi:WhiB family redox-sensing transcriptional regulator